MTGLKRRLQYYLVIPETDDPSFILDLVICRSTVYLLFSPVNLHIKTSAIQSKTQFQFYSAKILKKKDINKFFGNTLVFLIDFVFFQGILKFTFYKL